MFKLNLNIKNFDWWLIASVFILIILSCVIIYTVGINSENSDLSRFYKQVIFAIIGIIIMFVVSCFDYRFLNNYSYILYSIGAILLIAVLIFGVTIRGTTGWFNLGFVSFQPVEIAKILLLIFLARFFSIKAFNMDKIPNILLSIFWTGIYVVLVLRQPDLGSALIFLSIWLIFLLLSNITKFQISVLFFLIIIVLVSSWFLILEDYQKDRILTFIDPSRDALNTGYNVIQSITAVGSGQLVGRGLGLGPQSQLNFLPEQENDFIFAVIAEELGFVGILIIITLFSFIFYRIWKLSKNANDDFTLYLVNGFLIIFFIQTLINIGMNIGLMPVTGLPLPFVSSGGSSLVVSLMMIGIIQSIYQRQNLT